MTSRTVTCVIERRLLVNFAIDPDVLAAQLPSGLRPQLVGGSAVGGICFLRLAQLRPSRLPKWIGFRTENAAHRYAVEWDDAGRSRIGVFVERRDTNSRTASAAGGIVFPGRYHPAQFQVHEDPSNIAISVASRDRQVEVRVRGTTVSDLTSLLFASVDDSLNFFKAGSFSYSPSASGSCLDGVELASEQWNAKAVQLDDVFSSVFSDSTRFPQDSVTYDSALLMRNLPARFVNHGTASFEVPVPA